MHGAFIFEDVGVDCLQGQFLKFHTHLLQIPCCAAMCIVLAGDCKAFEDRDSSFTQGAAALITTPAYLTAAAGILAVEVGRCPFSD